MCLCALAAPCAIWYEYYARDKYCCTDVDTCCAEFQSMALDDVDVLCCCVDPPLRYQLFDPDWWCPQWAKELPTLSAVATQGEVAIWAGHGVPEAHVPDAIHMT